LATEYVYLYQCYHRLRGSVSTVVTMTSKVNGKRNSLQIVVVFWIVFMKTTVKLQVLFASLALYNVKCNNFIGAMCRLLLLVIQIRWKAAGSPRLHYHQVQLRCWSQDWVPVIPTWARCICCSRTTDPVTRNTALKYSSRIIPAATFSYTRCGGCLDVYVWTVFFL